MVMIFTQEVSMRGGETSLDLQRGIFGQFKIENLYGYSNLKKDRHGMGSKIPPPGRGHSARD